MVFTDNCCNIEWLNIISYLTNRGSSHKATTSIEITNKLTDNIKLSDSVCLLLPVLDFTSNLNLHLIRIV